MNDIFNPLNAKLNSICHLLVLLGTHLILHISRIRVNVRLHALSTYAKFLLIVQLFENIYAIIVLYNNSQFLLLIKNMTRC